jgi:SAM-dependent methyltransferase
MSAVIWHDLECGGYREDLALWRELAERHGDPILDVGAGSGRVTLALARGGHAVTALERDPELLAALEARAGELDLPVRTVLADAREFSLPERFPLLIVPMQTVQLLGGPAGRRAFLARARAVLAPGGVVAVSISERLEPFEVADGGPGPLPDMCECDGVIYASHPTAVRAEGEGFVLERRRETVDAAGGRTEALDRIRLDALSAAELEREGATAGLEPVARRAVPATEEYVGSEVVLLHG